jgi:hypothetical protein
MTRLNSSLLLTALGAAPLILTGCDSKMHVMFDNQLQKVLMNPQKGDTISWDVKVQFVGPPGFSPCESHNNPVSTCKINVDNQLLAYNCTDSPCPDPEMPVGPADGPLVKGLEALKPNANAATAGAVYVYIYCDNNGAAVLTPASETVAPGASLAWRGINGLNTWTVTFNDAGVCNPNSFNQTAGGCTLLTTGTHTYTANAPLCMTTPNVTGTVVTN